jgi:hypothetical protein
MPDPFAAAIYAPITVQVHEPVHAPTAAMSPGRTKHMPREQLGQDNAAKSTSGGAFKVNIVSTKGASGHAVGGGSGGGGSGHARNGGRGRGAKSPRNNTAGSTQQQTQSHHRQSNEGGKQSTSAKKGRPNIQLTPVGGPPGMGIKKQPNTVKIVKISPRTVGLKKRGGGKSSPEKQGGD